MSQITENQTVVVSSSETVANTAAATFSQEVDFRGSIGGVIQIDFQFATAPTADKTLDLYLLPALASGTDYDVYSQGRNVLLGSVSVEAVTTAQRLSILVDAVNCPYG
ncbi:hypothetical protein L2W58_08010, partial [Dethiosulfovibrio sp. F2B]|uniref:hypothetical protein n=1 Tax=Dethiosulfovibrio faecalis TaxID=2720018 RepID=UPI001F2B4903